jgi:GNAT superfamily N-acetyltransferase
VTKVSLGVDIATDKERAIAPLVAAFMTDPVTRWLYPDASAYLMHFPELARRFGGKAFEAGSAYSLDGYIGTSLWLPPGVQIEEEPLVEHLQNSVDPSRLEIAFGVLEQMTSFHPQEPHWYLPLIGVDPMWQGKGYGSALLRYTLTRCDEAGQSRVSRVEQLGKPPALRA